MALCRLATGNGEFDIDVEDPGACPHIMLGYLIFRAGCPRILNRPKVLSWSGFRSGASIGGGC